MLYFKNQLLKSCEPLSRAMLLRGIWMSLRNGPLPEVDTSWFQYNMWGEGIESALEEDWRRA